ncbi:hypothetical protein FOA43_003193 [Brettanomyces nanus]|uniref:Xylanolytic transcriptional activator regulatory domain-containing protein n=1 Tax=Eeniella nana TaxID=13502 RepID=A0A875S275_EENNA|nr:uncharacterized protein FOA43_003193 [Brettanomyces nanus]QPG75831.1 hypothetical protein FOA43_003193 [Brettanomyces nanus]
MLIRPTCSYCSRHGFSCCYKADNKRSRAGCLQPQSIPTRQNISCYKIWQSPLTKSTSQYTMSSVPANGKELSKSIDHGLPTDGSMVDRLSISSLSQSSSPLDPPGTPGPLRSLGPLGPLGPVASCASSKIRNLSVESSDLMLNASSTAECTSVGKIQSVASGFFPFHVKSPQSDISVSPGNYEVSNKDRKGSVFTNIINSALYNTAASPKEDLKLLYSFVPEKKVSDELFHRFRTSVHPVLPLLDWESLSQEYEKFWNDSSTADLPFYIRLFTVLYAASVSRYEEDCLHRESVDIRQQVLIMNRFVGSAEIALSMYHFPRKITIEGLQASVLLHSVLRNDCRTDDSGSVGTLIRLAQTIELHRDPLRYHGIKDLKTVQKRRLLWWQIFYLDTTTSLSNRLMPVVVEDEYDTLYPTEYIKDRNGQFILDQSVAFTNGKFRWAECSNRILRKAFSLKQMDQKGYEDITKEIENLSFYSSSLINRILEPANILPSQENFAAFSASILSTLADRTNLLFYMARNKLSDHKKSTTISLGDSPGYRRYDHVKLKSKTLDTSSVGNIQIECVDEQLVEHQIHLLSEFCKYGSMPKNRIFLWDIRKFQPIQSLLSLLRSLLLQAKQLQVRDNRPFFKDYRFDDDKKVKIIEKSISELDYLSTHTTRLCSDRWQLLKDLKDATWAQLAINSSSSQVSQDGDGDGSDKNTLSTYSDESLDAPDQDWYQLLEDLDKLQAVVDENINMKVWDQKAGHFLV